MGSSGNLSRVPAGVQSKVLAGTVAVASLGILFFLYRRTSAAGGGSSARGPLTFPSGEDPRRATQFALHHIRAGSICTCGELVAFLRGPAGKQHVREEVDERKGLATTNAYRIRIPFGFVRYIQESYLRGTVGSLRAYKTAAAVAASGGDGSTGKAVSVSVAKAMIERELFEQLLAADVQLRCLEVERATPFDNDNREHTSMLQQLWLASGRPLSTYSRTGPQWSALGFQGEDPVTDFRSGGVLALRQLTHFAQTYPVAFKEMIAYNKRIQEEKKDSWYLLAVVSIQLTAQLLLQEDHPFYTRHLEALYDCIATTKPSPPPPSSSPSTTSGSTGVPRRALAEQEGVDLRTNAVFWAEKPSDAVAGMFWLHHALLLHFKACWERDEPHVMEYNTYMPKKVYRTFFTEQWSPASAAAEGAK